MKFSLLVLAGALASANASSNNLSTTPRRLNDDGWNDDYWVDNEMLTSNNVITFEKCWGLIPQDNADEQDNNVLQEIKAGLAMPETSVVTAFITTDTTDAAGRIVLPAGDYLAAKIKAAALKDKFFCNTCNMYKEHCQNEMNYNYYNQNAAQNGNANGNGRNLFNTPSCSLCTSTCWENNSYDANVEIAAKFVEEAAKCMETGYKDQNGNQYWIGSACGSSGDAVELAAYLDEECIIESKKSVSTVLSKMGNYNGLAITSVLSYVSSFAQEAFANPYTSCYEPVYDDPEEENQENENGYNEKYNYANYVTSQVSQECKWVVGKSRFVSDCNPNQQEKEEAEEYNYQWWTIDVQDAQDMDEVCSVMNAKLTYGDETWGYFYDENDSGSIYQRDRHGNLVGSANSSNKMHGGLIFLIVVLVIGAVVAPVVWRIKKKRSAATNGDTSYQGGAMA